MGLKRSKQLAGLYLSGQQVFIPELNVAISQPKAKDIVIFGEEDFLFATQLLVHTDDFITEVKKGNSELDMYSNFQLLMTLIREDKTISNSLTKYLEFIFPDYFISIDENTINFFIEDNDKKIMVGRITPFSYDLFIDYIENLFIAQPMEEDPQYNPANDAAKAIMDKINAGRKKLQKQRSEESKDQSMIAQMASSLSIGLAIDINKIYEYTLFQIYDSYRRYFYKQSFDLYQKISTTPLMDVSKMETPDEWTKYMY